jgi:hypothetical protein
MGLQLIQAWHTALNTGDVDQLVALVDPNVEIVGPRGTVSGAQVVREWFGRANVRFTPKTYFGRGDTFVVEALGEWISPETSEVTGSQMASTVFIIHNSLITYIARYDALDTALQNANLAQSDVINTA